MVYKKDMMGKALDWKAEAYIPKAPIDIKINDLAQETSPQYQVLHIHPIQGQTLGDTSIPL
jgi:hypothetical protein